MKLLKKGSKLWKSECVCKGCGSRLLVEFSDLKRLTYVGEDEDFVSCSQTFTEIFFICSECSHRNLIKVDLNPSDIPRVKGSL
ncbi:hypothetical protein A3C09_03770 [Candidatus Uhrbacteria bacterium RIFCSPHIGHO2_02_FULL_47_44]|uniref:Uncharacterized protein n=1 Tax=Candidatus Uhrbacteria bacterium RIFCSPLOWO2_02_FULL_48_18 TaxID=1802408 RepID=A0A1F7VDX6_9BACT|nr:MAG: hypothetical protein A3C09_03770 [Candidatus Uhrbacteria bacterium RIFCSPHIGHO2_02_FULL_47_44]OGL80630.1 MAG: hypothetical protein A3B20_04515 [Candidatus Uhrbacteria bacterium RIFCSPLOWO2_01_FULL_47_17]OGL88187.1 MAG: hypothetical protein A3I41_00465 [Candidatus Uhrbacteria bacterium RIFCSPLOWO2_02_FULL_48_18]